MKDEKIKRGDKVKTIFGYIETVMYTDEVRVITYESSRQLSWYHPTKVAKENLERVA